MTFLLTTFRWLGLKGSVLALCAVVALGVAGWQYAKVSGLETSLALSEARVSVLQAERDAADALAADYAARNEKARAELAIATKALEVQRAARARKWQRIARDEPEWASQAVPESVVEALR